MQKSTLRLPFEETWFVLNGGDTKELNHHHGNKAQDYAFDFTILDKAKKSYKGDGLVNEDYYCFRQRVLAPGKGVVIEVVDGVRDNKPGFGNYLAGAGNYILILHQGGEVSFLAHLSTYSLLVKQGDMVVAGQYIGDSGNSGTSFAPHLHYHLQTDQPLAQYSLSYEKADTTYGNFPKKGDLIEVASAIKPFFKDTIVDGLLKRHYSPIRGNLVSNAS